MAAQLNPILVKYIGHIWAVGEIDQHLPTCSTFCQDVTDISNQAKDHHFCNLLLSANLSRKKLIILKANLSRKPAIVLKTVLPNHAKKDVQK